jgi:uncharacterized membrane protein YeiH
MVRDAARGDSISGCEYGDMIVFQNGLVILDWLGIVAFAVTGALVASRKQMDIVGFALLATVTGIGGGTLRDLLLDVHPILWIRNPEYLAVCILVSVIVFFTAHRVQSRMQLILWADAVGLALFSTVGAERAIMAGAPALVSVIMGIVTACAGGIIRDLLSQERSIIFSYEIYITAAMAAAASFVSFHFFGFSREIGVVASVLIGLALRGGALIWGWSLPRYRPRPPRN